jgi:hypothetical protein
MTVDWPNARRVTRANGSKVVKYILASPPKGFLEDVT